ncbi:hypothetical protein RDI58_019847 [Solanum bulbocastanum]|uniref:Uncharacterized protein n=1 Tax=Solanum bulbocastanum TaxID=147425 RepID=A0AAN8Y800_SOLBU
MQLCMPDEKHSPDGSVKTLKGEHKCDDPCGNYKVGATTIAFHFKEKMQANHKYKVKEMKFDFKIAFIINAHFEKCKRAKRIILENMEGSFCDDYKKLVGYANALKASNVGSDIVLKVPRDALSYGKRKFLRMYICFEAMKNGFKSGLRLFIGLDGKEIKMKHLKDKLSGCTKKRNNMACSSCGIPEHNARSCHKQCDEGKKQIKERHRTLIDKEDVEPSSSRSPNVAIVEDFPLKAPPLSQDCASNEHFEDFGLEDKDDIH